MKIISGGQSGVDRAALKAAKEAGIPIGGWCPRGGRAEDMKSVREIYPELQETSSANYSERTARNVQSADALLIVTTAKIFCPGTELTIKLAKESGLPMLEVEPDTKRAEDVISWILSVKPRTLMVAGPRESLVPGINKRSFALLQKILKDF